MSYRYETHLHTREASACARSCGSQYIAVYKHLGYSGICVTDHFFNGNTAIDQTLGWEEQVNGFCLGYERAKAEGDRQGLSVFFGWEHAFQGDEYLIYGLDKEWLLDHREMMEWDQHTLFEQIDRAGGLMIQAHPFRERPYIKEVNLHPYSCHGSEVINGQNTMACNLRSEAYANTFALSPTCGGDIHTIEEASTISQAMLFDEPLTTIHDFVDAVKAQRGYRLGAALPPICDIGSPSVPVYLHDRYQRKIPYTL